MSLPRPLRRRSRRAVPGRPLTLAIIGTFLALLLVLSLSVYRSARSSRSRLLEEAAVVSLPSGALQVSDAGGAGTPLLVLHGTPGGWDQGRWLGEDFAPRGFRILAPSRPGYLGSPVGGVPESGDAADRLGELLERHGTGPVGVVAWSGGAPVAVQLALRRPAWVAALVLLAPALGPIELPERPPSDLVLLATRALLDLAPGVVAPHVASDSIGARDLVESEATRHRMGALLETLVSHGVRATGRERDRRGLADLDLPLERLAVPVLVVYGTADETVGHDALERLVARIPRVETLEIPGAGHVLPLHPGYRRAVPTIADFLRRPSGRS